MTVPEGFETWLLRATVAAACAPVFSSKPTEDSEWWLSRRPWCYNGVVVPVRYWSNCSFEISDLEVI